MSELTYITKCRIPKDDGSPCPFTVTDHPLSVAVIGQPDARIQSYIQALMKHTQKKHPQAFMLAQMSGQFMFGYLMVTSFETQDPAIAEMKRKYEAQLRRYVTPQAVTDDEIEGALGAIGFTMDDPKRQIVRGALLHLRDYYEGKISQKAMDAEKSMLVAP